MQLSPIVGYFRAWACRSYGSTWHPTFYVTRIFYGGGGLGVGSMVLFRSS